MIGLVRTGYVKATGWAIKIRKVANAVMKGKADIKEINEKVSELNAKLYEVIVEKGVDRDDVVYIEVPFEIEKGKVKWIYDKIIIRWYKLNEEFSPFNF